MRRVHIDHFHREAPVPLTSILLPLCALCAAGPVPASTVPAIASVQVSKSNLAGGNSLLVAVTLTAQAPLGGSTVNITYSHQTVLSNPQKGITIPQGQSSGNFTLATVPTTTSVTVTITGSLGGSSANATVTVRPPQVQTTSLPSTIQGGSVAELSVTLDGPAPPGGSLLHLSFAPNLVTPVPNTFSINIGSTDFGGSYFGCGFDVLIGGGPCTTTMTFSDSATFLLVPEGGTTKTVKLLVGASREDRPVTGSVSVGVPSALNFTIRRPRPNSAAFVSTCSATADPITTIAGPASVQFRVITFDRVAKSGAYVNLSVRSSISVPSTTLELDQGTGGTRYGCLPVTLPTVSQSTSLMLIAEAGGATKSASISNVPLTVSNIVLSKDSVVSGTQVNATITMSAVSQQGATVQLSSSNTTAAPIAASVTVPSGAPSATVSFVPRVPLNSVSPVLKVIISATYAGSTRSDTVTVSR